MSITLRVGLLLLVVVLCRGAGAEEETVPYDPADHRVKLPALPDAAVEFHVDPDGDDAADGSARRPFATLDQARDAVRAWKASHADRLPPGGATVFVHNGAYRVHETLQLTAADSGTAEAPIVYRAAPRALPVLLGGVRLSSWQRLTDDAVRERLDPAVRDRVIQADLKAAGVTDFGDPTDLRRRPELFVNGTPQTLARWPNEGFVATGDILGQDRFKVWNSIDGCKDGKFHFAEDRPATWTDEPDVRLYGYWFWDWFDEYQRVASIDAAERTFTLAKPYSRYGYRKGQRYRAENVLRELDAEGEWYLDRDRAAVYWLPPAGVARASAVLSVHSEPFISLENVEHVTLLGLTLQEGRGDGIHVRGGSDCLIARCSIERLGGDAVVIDGGRRHGVFGCAMQTLGCGGMRVTGGNRTTLAPGGHFVENCTARDIARLKRTYAPAVRLDGCGNRIAHNAFSEMSSSAMRIEGNDHLIELNKVSDVVRESDDQGGIDMYGNPLYRGVVIRWNEFRDIGGGTQCGAAGVRLDDMISGVTVQGNVFMRCGAVKFGGVQIHGGKENLIDGNVFVKCFAGVSFSRWPEQRWRDSIERFLPQAATPAYAERYPALANLVENPNVNTICRNAFVDCGPTLLRDGGIQKTKTNAVSDDTEDPTASLVLNAIPTDDIGPYDHPLRAPQRPLR